MPRKKMTDESVHEKIAALAKFGPGFHEVAILAGIGHAVTSLLAEVGYRKVRMREVRPPAKAVRPKKQGELPINPEPAVNGGVEV